MMAVQLRGPLKALSTIELLGLLVGGVIEPPDSRIAVRLVEVFILFFLFSRFSWDPDDKNFSYNSLPSFICQEFCIFETLI